MLKVPTLVDAAASCFIDMEVTQHPSKKWIKNQKYQAWGGERMLKDSKGEMDHLNIKWAKSVFTSFYPDPLLQ